MADHDRDAGSRGDEDTPRDQARDETTGSPADRDTDEHPARPHLRYGEIPPDPLTVPMGSGWGPPPGQPPRSDSFRGFFRQKPAQILGAGLIGLLAGVIVGGTTVALVSDDDDRGRRYDMYWELPPDWDRQFARPEHPLNRCVHADGETTCDVVPLPKGLVEKDPARTG